MHLSPTSKLGYLSFNTPQHVTITWGSGSGSNAADLDRSTRANIVFTQVFTFSFWSYI